MFELSYKISDGDLKAASRAVDLKYAIVYLCVALCGLAAGIAPVVLGATKTMFVLGILLTVMGGFLLVCALLLLTVNKTSFESVVETGDDELAVTISHENITVTKADDRLEFSYSDMITVKTRKNFVLAYFGKTRVLLLKLENARVAEVYEYIRKRQGRMLPPSEKSE